MAEPSALAEPMTDAPGSTHAGDPAEVRVRAFVDGEYPQVVATVSLWAGSFDDATDAVTDALGRAWERLDRGRGIDNLAAWVTRVAMNRIRSLHRHRSVTRRNAHLLVVEASTADTERSAAALDLHRALGALTDRQREVVALYYGLDRSTAQIGIELGIAPGTVKATLAQARGRLAELLEPTRADEGRSR